MQWVSLLVNSCHLREFSEKLRALGILQWTAARAAAYFDCCKIHSCQWHISLVLSAVSAIVVPKNSNSPHSVRTWFFSEKSGVCNLLPDIWVWLGCEAMVALKYFDFISKKGTDLDSFQLKWMSPVGICMCVWSPCVPLITKSTFYTHTVT